MAPTMDEVLNRVVRIISALEIDSTNSGYTSKGDDPTDSNYDSKYDPGSEDYDRGSDTNVLLKQVTRQATNEFTGFPAVVVLPTDSFGEYATSNQNMEEYRVSIYIYESLPPYDNQSDAWELVTDLSHRIKAVIDSSRALGFEEKTLLAIDRGTMEEAEQREKTKAGFSRTLVMPVNCISTEEEVLGSGDAVVAELEIVMKVITDI